jgi:hypothetical protein
MLRSYCWLVPALTTVPSGLVSFGFPHSRQVQKGQHLEQRGGLFHTTHILPVCVGFWAVLYP